jgi:hypothetical protein
MTTTRQSRLGSLIAAGAIAVGAMTALAPAANADKPQTEGQIKAECGQANGNYYSSGVMPDGHTYSACCYNDYKGKRWCDSYQDGGYTTTLPATGKSLPPLGPGAGSTPPIAPPITNPPPGAAPPPPPPRAGQATLIPSTQPDAP